MDYNDVNTTRYELMDYDDVEDNIYAAINPAGNYSFYIGYKTIRWFLKVLHRYTGKNYSELKLLDVGCGDGHISRMMVSLLDSAKNVFAFDYSSNNVEHCNELNSSIKYEWGDVVNCFPFKNVKFDGITAFVVLSHLRVEEDVRHALENIYNALDEGGLFLWYELVSKSHYINPDKDTQGFNYQEIERYSKEVGFEEVAKKSFSKTLWLGKRSRSLYYSVNEHNIWFLELLAKILPFRPTITIRIFKK